MTKVKNRKGTVTRNFLVKMVFVLENIPRLGLVIICLSIFGLAVWVNISFTKPSATEMNLGRSSAFQGREIQDPLREPNEANILTFDTPAYPLEGFVPAHTNNLNVSFLYQCEKSCPQIWLTFSTAEQEKIQSIIHHPALIDLNWFHIIDNEMTIYQKLPTYRSFAELKDSNPKGLLTEKGIASDAGWNNESIRFLEDVESITDEQFVITTRKPISKLRKWHRFSEDIDIADIQRDERGQVTFFIEQRTSNLQMIKLANVNVAVIQ